MSIVRLLVIGVLAAMLLACGQDKGPAEAALKAATEAVSSVEGDGMKYAADQFGALKSSLTGVQDAFAKGDYKAVLTSAGELATKAKDVAAAAAAKKEELTKSWGDLSGGIPQMMGAIGSRLDILGQAKKLPDGMDKAALDGMKSSYDELGKKFEEAKSAFGSGDLAGAIEAGKMIKEKGTALAASLGLTAN